MNPLLSIVAAACAVIPTLTAQTPPCQTLNDSTNSVVGLIGGKSSLGPKTYAHRLTAATPLVIRGVRLPTHNQYVSSHMKVEIFRHDSVTRFPGARLASGTWWSPQSPRLKWQGANLDTDVVLAKGDLYWVAWTETGWSQLPWELNGTRVSTVQRTGPGPWISAPSGDMPFKVRLYCEYLDDTDVSVFGPACSGTNNLTGTLFTNEVPALPNPAFRLEGTGLPENATAFLAIGFDKSFNSIRLWGLAPGCYLNTDQFFLLTGMTGSGNIRQVSPTGYVKFDIPIPADPQLQGFFVAWQIAALDAKSSNPLPLVFTNGLRTTIN